MKLRCLFPALLLPCLALCEEPPKSLKPHPQAVTNTHAPGEVDRPEMVPFIVSDPASLPGMVVDETAATLVGEWQYSTHTPPYVGLGYLHDMKSGKGSKSVTFTPDLPMNGCGAAWASSVSKPGVKDGCASPMTVPKRTKWSSPTQ